MQLSCPIAAQTSMAVSVAAAACCVPPTYLVYQAGVMLRMANHELLAAKGKALLAIDVRSRSAALFTEVTARQ